MDIEGGALEQQLPPRGTEAEKDFAETHDPVRHGDLGG
jgi:hypothetical protein